MHLLTDTKWTCEQFQHAEDIAIQELSKVKDARFTSDNICKQINGWAVEIKDTKSWQEGVTAEGKPQWVGGLTNCNINLVSVNNESPLGGSFCHELAHVTQGCWVVNDACTGDDANHNCWTRDGEFAAVGRCNALAQ